MMNLRVAFATPYCERAEFRIALDPARHTEAQMAASLQTGVLYEQFTSWVMTGLLRPGDMAVDIGAHVGYYTLLMRTLVGATGQVFAAEPLPQSYAALCDNIALNGFRNVVATPFALTDRIGQQAFQRDDKNEGESHLVGTQGGAASAAESSTAASIMVATSTLDAWLAGLDRPPRLLKMDAEGCEGNILAGATQFFTRHRPDAVICEINPPALAQHGSDPWALRRQFKAMGYECFLINLAHGGPYDLCGGAILKPLPDAEQVEVNVVHNLLFAQPDARPVGLGV